MSERPKIPVPVKRAVLTESCHRCAVCGFGLSIELAHIIPWFETQDHRADNLIALCANCHEMADKQKWKKKDFEAYKKNPWALRNDAPQPMSAPQKAMVDLILAIDAADMAPSRRVQLVQMVAAYAGVVVADVKLVAVAASNSSLVRIEMPRDAAERIILGFQSEDPRLVSFLDEFALTSPVAHKHDKHASPFGLEGGLKLIETARPTPAEKPPVTNVKEEGLESLIVAAMTSFGWFTGEYANYDREYAVDLKQLTAFLEATQEEIAAELQLRMDGPVRRKFLAQLQGEITRRGTIDVMDKLSNIIKAFNDQFGGLFNDPKAVEKRIMEAIPPKVSADPAYQNARQNSDRQNARIEHDKALKRVITAMFKDDAQLFKQFQDNDSFRRWLTDTIFGMTYED